MGQDDGCLQGKRRNQHSVTAVAACGKQAVDRKPNAGLSASWSELGCWAAGLLVQEKWSVCTLVPCRGVEEAKARRLTHGRPLTSDRRVPPFPYRGETATHNKPDPPPCTVENGPAANTSGPAQSILFLRRRERSDWRLERRSFGVAHERRLKSASGEKMTNRRHTAVETRDSRITHLSTSPAVVLFSTKTR